MKRPCRLGVLFVHGIGLQPARDTLVRWGDRLVKTIADATLHKAVATIERAGPRVGRDGDGVEAEVRIDAEGTSERWLLCEAWWAHAFPPPSYRELVSWSVRALPWSLAVHIAQSYWHAPRDRHVEKAAALAGAFLKLSFALLCAPLLLTALTLMLLLGLLPIPQLRSSILAAQSALTATIGDSLAFVESPLRAALIRTHILDNLARLQTRCDRTIIIAHSQGAAAVLDAIGGIIEPLSFRQVPPHTRGEPPAPDTLVTFGAGINQLASLKVLSAGLPKKIGANPAAIAVWTLLASAAVIAWLAIRVVAGAVTLTALAQAVGLWALFVATLTIAATRVSRTLPRWARRWKRLRGREEKLVVGTLTALMLGAALAMFWYADRNELPFVEVSLGFAFLGGLFGAFVMILSRDMETVLAVVQKPANLGEWIDIYASSDPVPNGPTRTREAGVPNSVRIWSSGSMLSDHTSYWHNVDGFVLRVVRTCAMTAGSPWTSALPADTISSDERARWRVWFLVLSTWTTGLVTLSAGAYLLTRHFSRIALPIQGPGWLPPPVSQVLVGVVAVLLMTWAATGLIGSLWRRWVRTEQEAILAHAPPSDAATGPLTGIGVVVWIILGTMYGFVRTETIDVQAFSENVGELIVLPFAALGFSAISTRVLVWLKPPPPVTPSARPAQSPSKTAAT